jgi:hypothetical protein
MHNGILLDAVMLNVIAPSTHHFCFHFFQKLIKLQKTSLTHSIKLFALVSDTRMR